MKLRREKKEKHIKQQIHVTREWNKMLHVSTNDTQILTDRKRNESHILSYGRRILVVDDSRKITV